MTFAVSASELQTQSSQRNYTSEREELVVRLKGSKLVGVVRDLSQPSPLLQPQERGKETSNTCKSQTAPEGGGAHCKLTLFHYDFLFCIFLSFYSCACTRG